MTKKRPTRISLILCSRNRSAQLEMCLRQIPVKEIAEVHGELVLVDSCSEDNTWAVIKRFAESCHCAVTIVRAEQLGLGFARNVGIAASKGPILVFTDDDCYLAKGYIRKAVNVFKDAEFQYCGGKILLYDKEYAMYSVNYQDNFEIIPSYSFVETGKIQGANMVVHRQIFDEIGGFDTTLGAGTRLRCEDIEFIGRASMNGFTGAHVPELIVYHHHKRKNYSRALKMLIRKNEIARGAYYASMISQGFRNYLSNWIRHSVIRSFHKPWTYLYYRNIGRELLGALLYWQTRYTRKVKA